MDRTKKWMVLARRGRRVSFSGHASKNRSLVGESFAKNLSWFNHKTQISRLHFTVYKKAFCFAQSERSFIMDEHLDVKSRGSAFRIESSIITRNHNLLRDFFRMFFPH